MPSVLSNADRLWDAVDGRKAVYGIIHGPLSNKSNSRQLVNFGGRPMLIKSKDAREYESQFEAAVWRSTGNVSPLPPDTKLYLRATVYQENMRRDLDCELLPDLLQKFNIIKNDRQVWRKEYERRLDKLNPRVEFEVGVWDEQEAKRG